LDPPAGGAMKWSSTEDGNVVIIQSNYAIAPFNTPTRETHKLT